MKRISIAILIFLAPFCLEAQDDIQDFETWYRFRLTKKVGDIKLHVKPGIRLFENSLVVKAILSDFGASYKVHKYFGLTANYRYSRVNKYDVPFYSSQRLNLDLDSDLDVNTVNFSLRNRSQMDLDYRGWEFANRTKLSIKHDIGEGLAFFASTEGWLAFDGILGFTKYRFTFGLQADLAKRNRMAIYYRRQVLRGERVPTSSNIIGISYKLKLKSS